MKNFLNMSVLLITSDNEEATYTGIVEKRHNKLDKYLIRFISPDRKIVYRWRDGRTVEAGIVCHNLANGNKMKDII